MGPKASMETVAPTKASMPIADSAMPYVPQALPDRYSATPMTSTGSKEEREPTASPFVIKNAEPSGAISARRRVGL